MNYNLTTQTSEEKRKYFEACNKLAISKDSSIVLYPDQQKILVSDVIRDANTNILTIGGTREDGTVCWVQLKLTDNMPASTVMEDIENLLSTLASYCSPHGAEELEKYKK